MTRLKDQLTSEVSGIIMNYVREEKGRLTWISEVTGINRKEFTRRGLAKMKLYRLLRIIYALSLRLDEDEMMHIMEEVLGVIYEYVDDYDECLLTRSDD